MKFAKQLQSERIPEYADFYLDYKLGKKKIKIFQAAKRRGANQPSSSSRWRAIQAAQDVTDFLNDELHKVDKFYSEKEQTAIDRMLELKLQFNIYQEQLFARRVSAAAAQGDQHKDYARPYFHRNYARRKLKSALIEFYRGLDLLRSFVVLNSTAFRKLNKKFDKATGDRPLLFFYNKNVEQSHFAQSTAIEEITEEVEELFARHFEKGNRKAAVDELKTKSLHNWQSLSSAMFANGVFLGLGSTLALIGTAEGVLTFFHDDPQRVVETSYLLQLYGGYFLTWLMMILFCIACVVFDKFKINHSFIFQFSNSHSLNWRELLVIPLFLYFLFGGSMFLTFFEKFRGSAMRLYWFMVLIGLSVVTLCLPLPTFYHHTRRWLLKHTGRLSLSPLYPVRFADFFLGDLFCSLTYSFGNIEVFFCLYAHDFDHPNQCSSASSQLLGFFTAVPAIWRALQCIRRYRDTKAWMPHIPNFGKYCATCAAYATLSIYRIYKNDISEALYITCAVVNTIYCVFWDIKLDWSLGNTSCGFLREDLTFEDHKWIYWVAMVEDVLLRCNWVAYVASSRYPQHSSAISFFVALSEVVRRGVWMVFRVENEHWGNVRLTQAYRDPPLPFKVALELEEQDAAVATGADMERVDTRTHNVPLSGLRQRREAMNRTKSSRSVLDNAHMQDYVRSDSTPGDSSSTSEEEDED